MASSYNDSEHDRADSRITDEFAALIAHLDQTWGPPVTGASGRLRYAEMGWFGAPTSYPHYVAIALILRANLGDEEDAYMAKAKRMLASDDFARPESASFNSTSSSSSNATSSSGQQPKRLVLSPDLNMSTTAVLGGRNPRGLLLGAAFDSLLMLHSPEHAAAAARAHAQAQRKREAAARDNLAGILDWCSNIVRNVYSDAYNADERVQLVLTTLAATPSGCSRDNAWASAALASIEASYMGGSLVHIEWLLAAVRRVMATVLDACPWAVHAPHMRALGPLCPVAATLRLRLPTPKEVYVSADSFFLDERKGKAWSFLLQRGGSDLFALARHADTVAAATSAHADATTAAVCAALAGVSTVAEWGRLMRSRALATTDLPEMSPLDVRDLRALGGMLTTPAAPDAGRTQELVRTAVYEGFAEAADAAADAVDVIHAACTLTPRCFHAHGHRGNKGNNGNNNGNGNHGLAILPCVFAPAAAHVPLGTLLRKAAAGALMLAAPARAWDRRRIAVAVWARARAAEAEAAAERALMPPPPAKRPRKAVAASTAAADA